MHVLFIPCAYLLAFSWTFRKWYLTATKATRFSHFWYIWWSRRRNKTYKFSCKSAEGFCSAGAKKNCVFLLRSEVVHDTTYRTAALAHDIHCPFEILSITLVSCRTCTILTLAGELLTRRLLHEVGYLIEAYKFIISLDLHTISVSLSRFPHVKWN